MSAAQHTPEPRSVSNQTRCMVNNPEDCFGPCPCGERQEPVFSMRSASSVDIELPGERRRRVFFDAAGEPCRVWMLPHGGKQTERNVRPGTNDWHNSVEAARAAIAKATGSQP